MMKKRIFLKLFVIVIILTTTFNSCNYIVIDENDLIKCFEEAYFEGQKDYANNDIRIKFTQDSCWVWTKSPWNSGEQPIYDPSIIYSKN
jgi:hypothetical protein